MAVNSTEVSSDRPSHIFPVVCRVGSTVRSLITESQVLAALTGHTNMYEYILPPPPIFPPLPFRPFSGDSASLRQSMQADTVTSLRLLSHDEEVKLLWSVDAITFATPEIGPLHREDSYVDWICQIYDNADDWAPEKLFSPSDLKNINGKLVRDNQQECRGENSLFVFEFIHGSHEMRRAIS